MAKRFTRDSDQKIQSIYQAFQELVNESGYDSLTTRKVASKAQISVGTVYHYFPEGKAAIAAGLYERNLLETIDINDYVGHSRVGLRDQITRHLRLHTKNKELYRAFDVAIYTDTDLFDGIKKKRNEVLGDQLGSDAPLLNDILRVYAIIDSIIHRHLFVEPLFNSEEELIDHLVVIADASINY
jgi:AcrR family transcriptional regulator